MKYNISFRGTIDLEPADRPVASDLIQNHLDYDPLVYYPADEPIDAIIVKNYGSLADADIEHKNDDIAGLTRGLDDRMAPLYGPGQDATHLYTLALANALDLSNSSLSVHFRIDRLPAEGRSQIFRLYRNGSSHIGLAVQPDGAMTYQWVLGGNGEAGRQTIDVPADVTGIVVGQWHSVIFAFGSKMDLATGWFDGRPVAEGPCGYWEAGGLNGNGTVIGASGWQSPEHNLLGSVAHLAIFNGILGENAAKKLSGR